MRTTFFVAGVTLALAAGCGGKKSSGASCGSTTSGTFTTTDDGQLDDCNYNQAGSVALFSGSLGNGVSLDVQVPSGPGTVHCDANAGIVITYGDKNGVTWAAASSNGSQPQISGTCTIVAQSADANG